jgi:hypothetical protein
MSQRTLVAESAGIPPFLARIVEPLHYRTTKTTTGVLPHLDISLLQIKSCNLLLQQLHLTLLTQPCGLCEPAVCLPEGAATSAAQAPAAAAAIRAVAAAAYY